MLYKLNKVKWSHLSTLTIDDDFPKKKKDNR